MALLCAGTKSIMSLMAFVCSFCRTQAITGGYVSAKAVQCIAMSLDLCWAGGGWMLEAAGGFSVSRFPGLKVMKSVHTANHERYQAPHVARETSCCRHSP